MMQLVKSLAIYQFLASFPLVFFLVVLCTWLIVKRRLPIHRIPWLALACGMVMSMLLMAFGHLILPSIFEDLETMIASVAYLWVRHFPLYPPLDSVASYGEVYGPVTYVPGAIMFLTFGNHLFAAKLPGILAILATLWATYRICRRYAAPAAAITGVGCVTLAIARWGPVGFWAKGDPILIAGAALGVLAVLRGRTIETATAAGLYFGLAPNIKASACAYLIPLFALIVLRKGWRTGLGAVALGAVLLPAPFFLSNVSFSNWLGMLRLASRGGMTLDLFSRLLQYSFLYLLPVLALVSAERRSGRKLPAPLRIYLASIMGSMFVTCLLTCRPGASAYHLLPFLPYIVHLYFWLRSELPNDRRDAFLPELAVPLMLVLCFYAVTSQVIVVNAFRFVPKAYRALHEIHNAEQRFGNRQVELGFGDDFGDRSTWFRYQTTFDGEPYTLDGPSVRDHQADGVEVPEATIRYLERCGTAAWLIPKGKPPFMTKNPNFLFRGTGNHLAFEDKFRRAFLDHYQLSESWEIYDLWSCRVQ